MNRAIIASLPIKYEEDMDSVEIILSHPDSPQFNMLITLSPQYGQGRIYLTYVSGTNVFGGRVPINAMARELGIYGLSAKALYHSAGREIGKALANGAKITSIVGSKRQVNYFIREVMREFSGEAAREREEELATRKYCKDCKYFSIIGCKHPDPRAAGSMSRWYRNRSRKYIYNDTIACQKGYAPKAETEA